MEAVAHPTLPRGCDVSFGKEDDPQNTLMALGPDLSLALAERDSNQMWVCDPSSELKLVLLDSPITALGWLSVDYICVGLSTGIVVTIPRPQKDDLNTEWFFAQFHTCAVSSLRLSRATPSGHIVSVAGMCKAPLAQGTLWVVYRDRTVVAVAAADMLPANSNRRDQPSPMRSAQRGSNGDAAQKSALWPPPPTHTRLELTAAHENGGNSLSDAVACAPPTPSLLDLAASLNPRSVTLLACGAPPYPIAHYVLGEATSEVRGLRQIARQAAHALKVTAVSFLSGALGGFLGSSSSSATTPTAGAADSDPATPSTSADHQKGATVVTAQTKYMQGGLRDERRQVSRVWVDPTLQYALCADQLGRVMLVDVARQTVVRLWKGVRDAECGWVQEPPTSSSTSPWGFSSFMAIYSPRRGFVELFAAVHGPKVRTVAVGTNARLLSTNALSSSAAAMAMANLGDQHVRWPWGMRSVCCVLRADASGAKRGDAEGGGVTKLELLQLSDMPTQASAQQPGATPTTLSSTAPTAPTAFSHARVSPALLVGAGESFLSQALSKESLAQQQQPSQARGNRVERALELDSEVVQDVAEAIAADMNAPAAASSMESQSAAEELRDCVFTLFRRLRTGPGVQDALLLILKLPLLESRAAKWAGGGKCWRKQHCVSFLNDVTAWTLDADASGLLLGAGDGDSSTGITGQHLAQSSASSEEEEEDQEVLSSAVADDDGSDGDAASLFGNKAAAGDLFADVGTLPPPTSSSSPLTAFLRQREILIKAHAQVCELLPLSADNPHRPTAVEARGRREGKGGGADAEKGREETTWLTESWRAEGHAWVEQQLQFDHSDVDEDEEGVGAQGNTDTAIPLGTFLTALEVDSSCAWSREEGATTRAEQEAVDSRRDLLADCLFSPLLHDVFAVNAVGRLLSSIGPSLGGGSAGTGPFFSPIRSPRSPHAATSTATASCRSLFDGPAPCSAHSTTSTFPQTAPDWSPALVSLFARWFLRQPLRTLLASVLDRAAQSSGVVRFLEALCTHLPGSDGSTPLCDSLAPASAMAGATSAQWAACLVPPSAQRVIPLWEPIFSACAAAPGKHASAFALAAATQEATARTLKLVEAKTYGLALDADSSLGDAWPTLLRRLRCCLLVTHRRRAVEACLGSVTDAILDDLRSSSQTAHDGGPLSADEQSNRHPAGFDLEQVDPLGGFEVHAVAPPPPVAAVATRRVRSIMHDPVSVLSASTLHVDEEGNDNGEGQGGVDDEDEAGGEKVVGGWPGCEIGRRKLLRLVVSDRCALDVLASLQRQWKEGRRRKDSLGGKGSSDAPQTSAAQPERLNSPRESSSPPGYQGGDAWPDPRAPSGGGHAMTTFSPQLWPHLAQGSIMASPLSRQIAAAGRDSDEGGSDGEERPFGDAWGGSVRQSLALAEEERSLALTLPATWVPLLELFALSGPTATSTAVVPADDDDDVPTESKELDEAMDRLAKMAELDDSDVVLEGKSAEEEQCFEKTPEQCDEVAVAGDYSTCQQCHSVSRAVVHSYCAAHLALAWGEEEAGKSAATAAQLGSPTSRHTNHLEGVRAILGPLFATPASSSSSSSSLGVAPSLVSSCRRVVGVGLVRLALAHVTALAENKIPRVPPQQHERARGTGVAEEEGGSVGDEERPEVAAVTKEEAAPTPKWGWDSFFDYDVPADGLLTRRPRSKDDAKDEQAGVEMSALAACLAVSIFEDVAYPCLLLPFLAAQRKYESEEPRLSACFMPCGQTPGGTHRGGGGGGGGCDQDLNRKHRRRRETVHETCSALCGVLKHTLTLVDGEAEGALKNVCAGLLLEPLPCDDGDAGGVEQDEDSGEESAGDCVKEEEKAFVVSSLVRELWSCGGDAFLVAVAVKPSLAHPPALGTVHAMMVALRTINAIVAVGGEASELRPPIAHLFADLARPWERVERVLGVDGRSFRDSGSDEETHEGDGGGVESSSVGGAASTSPQRRSSLSGLHLRLNGGQAGAAAALKRRQPSSLEVRASSATATATTGDAVRSFRGLLEKLFVEAVRAPVGGGKGVTVKRRVKDWSSQEVRAQAEKVRVVYQLADTLVQGGVALSSAAAAGEASLGSIGWLGAIDWKEEALLQHAFALLCAGGQDEKALEVVARMSGRTDVVAESIMLVCGSRITQTIQACERDTSGRLTPLLAALDARLCARVANIAKARKGSSPALAAAAVNMQTVSHDGTLALLGYVAHAASFRSVPSPHTTSIGSSGGTGGRRLSAPPPVLTFAEEANEMRDLLDSTIAGLTRLGQQRPVPFTR